MSRREDAIATLVLMLHDGEHRDQISAADKILRSTNIAREHLDQAVRVLENIMHNELAEPRDRVNAAAKLKDWSAPQASTKRDIGRQLASLTMEELRAQLDAVPLGTGHDPLYD